MFRGSFGSSKYQFSLPDSRLHGKDFIPAISNGGSEEVYQAGGYNHFSMNELTNPFQVKANLNGIRFQLRTYDNKSTEERNR